uniref:F-box associated beta-propeller type 3 domain-containing protein n=1 Tax=Oryza brachyantha TaxID=4533 RepID=J3MU27_ORYBR
MTKRKREGCAAADGEEIVAGAQAPPSSPSAGAICDDVVRHIFARLPARDAVASMVLSPYHRRLITSQEFRRLHCRHGEPLPRPHIAYVATAAVFSHRHTIGRVKSLEKWAQERAQLGFGTGGFACMSRYDPADPDSSRYHGFHVAGAGRTNPMRALAGKMYNHRKYVGTCNGVILLSGGLLLNPAVADGHREVPIDTSSSHILGFGYGPRTGTYKLLVSEHKWVPNPKYPRSSSGGMARLSYGGPAYGGRARRPPSPSVRADELLVYSLGSAAEEQPRTLLAGEPGNETIRSRTVYIDGTVYLLNPDKGTVLAFDVDDEIITSIDLPGEPPATGGGEPQLHVKSELIEMSGRVCVATVHDGDKERLAVWLLNADRQWERRCILRNGWAWPRIAGVWDCGGVVLAVDEQSTISLYDDATGEVSQLNPPPDASPEMRDYRVCWGYKPTLVSPASVVGELNQGEQQQRDLAAKVLAAVNPLNEMNKRKGQDAALHIVCFMEFLVSVMRELPGKLHHGIGDLDELY